MLPSTLLGVVVAIAALGPGFVYIRIAERYGPRPDRSQLSEAVEMLIVGSVCSSLAALLVLLLGEHLTNLDLAALAKNANDYVITHPGYGFGGLAAFFAITYGVATIAGWARHIGRERPIHAGSNGWHRVLWEDRPRGNWAFVTATLEDGTRVAGSASRWTAEFGDNRELVLTKPIAIQAPNEPAKKLDQAFFVVREDHLRSLEGHYVPAASARPAKESSKTRWRQLLGSVR